MAARLVAASIPLDVESIQIRRCLLVALEMEAAAAQQQDKHYPQDNPVMTFH